MRRRHVNPSRRQAVAWLAAGLSTMAVAVVPVRWISKALGRPGPSIPTVPFDESVLDEDHDLAG